MSTAKDYSTMTDEEVNAAIELELFGDDLTANTDERIGEAILQRSGDWRSGKSGEVYFVLYDDRCCPKHRLNLPLFGRAGCSKEWAVKLWHNRHGQPWQSALESHVAAYRRKPRNFCGDGNLMLEVMKAMAIRDPSWKLDLEIFVNKDKSIEYRALAYAQFNDEAAYWDSPNAPAAVARAALIALSKEGEECPAKQATSL